MRVSFFVLGVLIAVGSLNNPAKACSVAPIDMDRQIRDMQRFALTALDIEQAQGVDIDVSDASGSYFWFGNEMTMCPNGLTAKATFSIVVQDKVLFQKKVFCRVKVTVSKRGPLQLFAFRQEYKIEVSPRVCLHPYVPPLDTIPTSDK